MSQHDVIVVGAGIVGLAAARRLAAAGARTLVVESSRVGAEASSAAAGILSAQAEAEDSPLLPLALAARDHHADLAPRLLEETGVSVDYAARGLLQIALGEDEEAALHRSAAWQGEKGLVLEHLSADEIREVEPNLNPAVRAALYLPEDRQVDNVRLTRALAAAAVARGASLLTGRPVSGLLVEDGRLAGLHAGRESYRAAAVINAAGAWAGLLPGDPQPPPVEPVRGQMVAFEMAPPLVRHVVFRGHRYLVPRSDGRVLAGSTTERVGFDKSITASGLHAILESALAIAPALRDVPLAGAWAGLRPGTPDGLPVIGQGALPGLFHACGLYRNGILLGPLVGEIVAGLVLGEAPPLDVSAFSLGRLAA